MNVKKFTEAAVLSALLIAVSLFAKFTVVLYGTYMDLVVPIIITLIYYKCGFKYSLLSTITSVLLFSLFLGNLPAGLWMLQSSIYGFAAGYFSSRKSYIFDDLFYSSIISTFVIIIFDLYMSGIMGYSILEEFNGYMQYVNVDSRLKDIMFYAVVAIMPLGTMLLTYLISIFAGNRLKILNENLKEKLFLIKRFKTFGSLMINSKKVIITGFVLIAFAEIFSLIEGSINIYIKVVVHAVEYVSLYFVLKDSYGYSRKTVYSITKNRFILSIYQFIFLAGLFVQFKITAAFVIALNIFGNIKFKFRNKEEEILSKVLLTFR